MIKEICEVGKTIKYIKGKIKEPFTIKELADFLKINVSTCWSRFIYNRYYPPLERIGFRGRASIYIIKQSV